MAGVPGDDNATGNNVGAVHIWREVESGFDPAEKVTSGVDWLPADAVGSAVAVDVNVIVAAGLDGSGTGDPMTVRTVEIPLTGPATSTWSFRENLVVGVNQGPNDYVDIDDGTIAARRPGAGSEVLVFQDAGPDSGLTDRAVRRERSQVRGPHRLRARTRRSDGHRRGPGRRRPNDAGSVYSFQIPEPVPPTVPPSGLSLDITSATASTEVGVDAIDISSLPSSVFQGYGGPTADYARADLQTIDLRSDTTESTPVADVTLADLALDTAPVTRGLLSTILLSDIPRNGGWSALLRPNGPLLVEQTITLLDIYRDYPAVLDQVRLGDLGLQASTLGSISTYAALLAGVPVDQLPVPDSAGSAQAFWCDLVTDAGLDCATDFGSAPLTLPVLSFAGVDVEQADFLGALIDGATDLSGTPIGSTPLGKLNIGDVPLASQPLVPSKSLPSYLPSTVDVPDAFLDVTLGELGQAAPLGALSPEDLGIDSTDSVSALDLEFQPDSPLADYSWVAPAAGASLLVTNEAPLDPDVAEIQVGALGLNAPVLSVPLDEIILPNGRALADYRLVELLGGAAEFGAAPFAASPFAASPFGAAPFAASSIGASPFRASPFRASPFRASPFRGAPSPHRRSGHPTSGRRRSVPARSVRRRSVPARSPRRRSESARSVPAPSGRAPSGRARSPRHRSGPRSSVCPRSVRRRSAPHRSGPHRSTPHRSGPRRSGHHHYPNSGSAHP